ncbi:MAG: 5-(carboxyamino)imidazole ribonucleotide synthase [Candidatus Dormiibacterota bacterium]
MGQRIGCLGGGQLGRMLALAGLPLGLRFTFLEPQADAAAADVGRQLMGAYDDPELLRQLGAQSDLVTFEFESVPEGSASLLAETGRVFPPPRALAVGQDRLLEKQLFQGLGIETASYREVGSPAELASAAEVGFPALLKTRRLGYDGHGQRVVEDRSQLESAWQELDRVPSILERLVPFDRELSILCVRGADGETAAYPVVENHHREGILRLTLAPAPKLTPELAQAAATIGARILEELEYVGVLAVELFEFEGRLLANEIAPRVHNSGHWTMNGAECSQFENHLRAGLGWPLGGTENRGYTAMINLLGEEPDPSELLTLPSAHLHLYGKEPRPRRKLGHLNIVGEDSAQVTAQLQAVASVLRMELSLPGHADSLWGAGRLEGGAPDPSPSDSAPRREPGVNTPAN